MSGHGNTHVLPDSRLSHRPELGCFMGDWPLPGGGCVRCEIQPTYCAGCGKLWGYVPRDNTYGAMMLCQKCFDKYGAILGTYAMPDEDFRAAVAFEMEAKFRKTLNELEIFKLAEHGDLGSALEKLEKESPYPVPSAPVGFGELVCQ